MATPGDTKHVSISLHARAVAGMLLLGVGHELCCDCELPRDNSASQDDQLGFSKYLEVEVHPPEALASNSCQESARVCSISAVYKVLLFMASPVEEVKLGQPSMPLQSVHCGSGHVGLPSASRQSASMGIDWPL